MAVAAVIAVRLPEGTAAGWRGRPVKCRAVFPLYNLWDKEEFAAVKSEMLGELAAAMMRAQDPLPVPHFRYRTKVHPRGYWYQEYRMPDPGVGNMEGIGKRLGEK